MKIWSRIHGIRKTIDHIDFACEFVNFYLKKCSNIEMCKLTKNVLACFDKLNKQSLFEDHSVNVRFIPCSSSIHDVIRQHFGNFDLPISNSSLCQSPDLLGDKFSMNGVGDLPDEIKQLTLNMNGPIVPLSGASLDGISSMTSIAQDMVNNSRSSALCNGTIDNNILQSGNMHNQRNNWNCFNLNLEGSDFLPNSTQVDNLLFSAPYFSREMNQSTTNSSLVPNLDVDTNLIRQRIGGNYNSNLYEYCRLRASRSSQMNLLAKWGSLGCELGRLNCPHGFCLGFEEEIVVADTYNHRIQVCFIN